MLNVLRPSFEVFKEGRIFLTEKRLGKISPYTRTSSDKDLCGYNSSDYLDTYILHNSKTPGLMIIW